MRFVKLKTSLLVCVCMLAAGCDKAIYDYDDDCKQGIMLRFAYDHNMEWADAFPSQVHCLSVLVYGSKGEPVAYLTERSESLRKQGYGMPIDLPYGSYHIVAYGGMECESSSFEFHQDPLSVQSGQLQVQLGCEKSADNKTLVSHSLLHDHFFGSKDVVVGDPDIAYKADTLAMMKNTNHFRLVLQQVQGVPLKAADFHVSLTDDNTLFASDNSIVATDTPVTYLPWNSGESDLGINSDGQNSTVAYYEISTSRLIARGASAQNAFAPSGTSNVESPRLLITSQQTKSGEENIIADVPLLKYLLLLKSDRYANLSDQEFLDRQSQWNIVFFLDNNMQWINTHIVVNDWVVRLNNAGL